MAEGNVVDIAALASIHVIHGGATHRVAFHGARPSRLVVGSDASATLRLERSDVAPRQFDVVWDGAQLWLQDSLRLGRTFVNGRTLNEWTPVVRQAMVCFGNMRLWMTSRSEPPREAAPDFAALDRAALTDAHQSARLRLSDTSRITLTPELLRAFEEQEAL
jgi:hypothetical protein